MSTLTRTLRTVRARLRGDAGPLLPRLTEGMHKLHDVLSATPLAEKYWINGGLLLGYIRCGGPLPHDDDVDFSFWRDDREHLLAAIPRLQSVGFRKWRLWTNNEQQPTEWSLNYRGVAFEFFEMHRTKEKMRWYCYGGKPAAELLNEAPLHGLDSCCMFGRSWQMPDDPQTYLRSLYGDWQTPEPHYNYVRDSQAIIRRRPWLGSSKW